MEAKEELYIDVIRIPDGRMPCEIGQMSYQPLIPRPGRQPLEQPEWQVKLPCSHIIALTDPPHQVYIVPFEAAGGGNSGISVYPSIICPTCGWHGWLVYSRLGPMLFKGVGRNGS